MSYTFSFGKHKGKKIEDVDASYLQWIVKQHADKGDFDEDLVVQCEDELRSRGESIPYVE